MAEWLAVAVLLALGWQWWDSLQKRELALSAARRACEQAGVQFLDDSVALRRLRVRRDEAMRARFYREFAFEYSVSGDDRHPGRVFLLGSQILSASLIQTAA